MARIVLVLIVCTILMFIAVLRTPPQFVKAALSAHEGFTGGSVEDADEEEKLAAESASKTRGAARKLARRSGTVSSEPKVSTVPESAPEMPASNSSEPAGPYILGVATDETALYSLNSTNGTIVGVLRRGDIVEPQLEIKDAGQTWAFVNVAGRKMSGFVQKDNLERQRLGQTSQ